MNVFLISSSLNALLLITRWDGGNILGKVETFHLLVIACIQPIAKQCRGVKPQYLLWVLLGFVSFPSIAYNNPLPFYLTE